MSSNKESVETRDYADEIGVSSVPLSIAKLVAQLCWHDGHVPLFIGESGTGKTASMRQLARFNNMDLIPFHLSNTDSADVRGPAFPQPDGTFKYLPPGHIPIQWKPSTRQKRILHQIQSQGIELEDVLREDFDPNTVSGLKDKDLDTLFEIRAGVKKEKKQALLMFDEMNRGDKDAMNAVMPVWTEHLLGAAHLGPNVRIMGAMNPPGGAYVVNSQISNDPAMRRRVCMVVVNFSQSEFLRYAENPAAQSKMEQVPPLDYAELQDRDELRAWHQSVVGYVRQNPDSSMDYKSREAGKVYACPPTWDAVSDTMFTVERLDLDLDTPVIRQAVQAKLSGHIGLSHAMEFLAYYKEKVDVLDPIELIYHYEPKTPIWKKVQRRLKASEYLGLMNVLESSIRYILDPGDEDFEMKDISPQFARLANDLPANCAQDMISLVGTVSEEIHGSHTPAMRDLMNLLMKDENYLEYQKRTLKMSVEQQDQMADDASP